jgi:hypothetical protein
MTSNTQGSTWVPYEYGRVKDSSPYSRRAACWIDSNAGKLPEYLELGVRTRTDDEIRTWLQGELASWNLRYPASVPVQPPVAPGNRRSMTADQLQQMKDRLRYGHGYTIPAPAGASFKKKRKPPPSTF